MINLSLDSENISKQSKFYLVIFAQALFSTFSSERSALKTAVPETLYAALQSSVGNESNVAEIMDGWVTQPGFPVLNVKLTGDRKHLIITQKRFLRSNPNHQDKTLWNVPLTYATDKENSNFSNTKPVALLTKESSKIDLKEPAEWIVLNVQQSGKVFGLILIQFTSTFSNFNQ